MIALILMLSFVSSPQAFIESQKEAVDHLEAMYSISSLKPINYKPSQEEAAVIGLAFDHIVQQEHNAADLHYQKVREKYPNSPKAALNHLLYYIWRNRWKQAIELAEKSSMKFPSEISFKIIRDSLKKRESSNSERFKDQVLSEMDVLLAAWNEYQASLGKKLQD